MVERLRTLSPRMRKLVRIALALMAAQVLLIVLRVGEFVFGAPTSAWVPTTLLMCVLAPVLIGQSLYIGRVRVAETEQRQREAAERKEFRRLRASDPAPGQCPVCGLADLDERAIGDELLGDSGTALARVVGYGPDRAHSECAAVVPYVAPLRSASGGTTQIPAKGSRMASWLAPAVEAEGERLLTALRSQAPKSPSRARSLKGGYIAADVPVSEMPFPEVLTRPALNGPVANNTLRASIESPPEWSGFGELTFAEVQNWRKCGFTPERARAWIQNGFATPQEADRTGFRWPNELRAANGWPLLEPEQDDWPMPAVATGHVAFTMGGKHTYCVCGECESLRRDGD